MKNVQYVSHVCTCIYKLLVHQPVQGGLERKHITTCIAKSLHTNWMKHYNIIHKMQWAVLYPWEKNQYLFLYEDGSFFCWIFVFLLFVYSTVESVHLNFCACPIVCLNFCIVFESEF